MIEYQPENFQRVVISGIDGSGKSTAAYEAARLLSEAHPDASIRTADSTGVSTFRGGEKILHQAKRLEEVEPTSTASKLETLVRMGAFTLGRQSSEQILAHKPNSLVIGVRDPFRIDLAAYSTIFGPSVFKKMSAASRLRLFDTLTFAAHPGAVVYLNTDSATALQKAAERSDTVNTHETPEKLAMMADELPKVIDAYKGLYRSNVTEVTALQPRTSDTIAAVLERYLPRR